MAAQAGEGYANTAAAEVSNQIQNLGPMMSMDDPVYRLSAAKLACNGAGPECETPGFDPQLLPDTSALLGRWVRSPSKFVGWDTYMEFFGLSGDKALQETEEPQEHVILEFSKEKLRINHRLCWRDGLDCEYTVPMDGSMQPVPPAMVARASSSWKVNDLATWEHAWDHGDGNPLHRGLRTQQKLNIGGTNYALRYWRSLIRANEMRINVEVTYADTGKYAVHTQRFFRKIDVDRVYALSYLPRAPTTEEVTAKVVAEAVATHAGRGVRLVVLPHACNMSPGSTQWAEAEPFPTAGRSSGPFLTAVRLAAREAGLWLVCGVTLRAGATEPETGPKLLKGVALIGADGWLHGVHTDMTPPTDGPYLAGTGEWPATQRARPLGVYDTELGRIAIAAATPNKAGLQDLASFGAEMLVVPPEASCVSKSGAQVSLASNTNSVKKFHTRYELCGPEALEKKEEKEGWKLTISSIPLDHLVCDPLCIE